MTNLKPVKFVDSKLVQFALDNSKGQFMSLTALKKCDTPRKWVFKICKENAPSHEKHPELRSLKATNGRYGSFNINRVVSMTVNKTELKAS